MWRGLVLTTLIPLGACGDSSSSSGPDPTDAVLAYRFQDASVPPEYHRSYTLDLTGSADGAHGELVVDSYGDEVVRVEVDVPADAWTRAVSDLEAFDAVTTTDQGCAGGTGREVELTAGGETLIAADIEVCGGAGQDVADELDATIAPLLAGLDMEALLATG